MVELIYYKVQIRGKIDVNKKTQSKYFKTYSNRETCDCKINLNSSLETFFYIFGLLTFVSLLLFFMLQVCRFLVSFPESSWSLCVNVESNTTCLIASFGSIAATKLETGWVSWLRTGSLSPHYFFIQHNSHLSFTKLECPNLMIKFRNLAVSTDIAFSNSSYFIQL